MLVDHHFGSASAAIVQRLLADAACLFRMLRSDSVQQAGAARCTRAVVDNTFETHLIPYVNSYLDGGWKSK